jgi:riboflavin kinase/FMN adenylyltransferase
MQLIRGLYNLRPQHQGCVATIGNFDGLHRGHQALLNQLKAYAREHQLPTLVILFEPQPQEYFVPQQAPPRLTTCREKLHYLKQANIDQVLVIRFSQQFCQLTAQTFIESILVRGLAIKALIVGDDFRFGRDRQGDYQLLAQAASRYGFQLARMTTLEIAGQRVSSSRIRKALAAADFTLAETLLGRPFSISGRVIHGRKLGQQLGIPTANIAVKRQRSPLQGVFVVQVRGLGPKAIQGIANIGNRPTLAGERLWLEAHLLAFNRSIYGQRVAVEFLHKVRAEQQFANLNRLKQQIIKDIQLAKAFFARAE